MTTAALIVAAGMSSRMGDFKPMLNIGSISIAQRVVATFQQAGVEKIVMITGYNATAPGTASERQRRRLPAKRGLSDHADVRLRVNRAALSPGQMRPRALYAGGYPALHRRHGARADGDGRRARLPRLRWGETGHPTLIASALIDRISGRQRRGRPAGRDGALRHGADRIPVDDPGILHDADTPEDYRALLAYHNEHLVRPVLSISLSREKVFFDARTAMLLRLVEETASVRTACQRMQMSYSSGWNVIRTLESQLSRTLIRRSQGGAGGGKSSLTEDGKLLLERFEAYSEALREQAGALFDQYFEGLF